MRQFWRAQLVHSLYLYINAFFYVVFNCLSWPIWMHYAKNKLTYIYSTIVRLIYVQSLFVPRSHCQPIPVLNLSTCLSIYRSPTNNKQLFNVWEVNRPEYFLRDAGNSSMLSITQGQRPRAIERIELFPAPKGKCSSLLTNHTLNNCFIIYFQLFYIISVFSFYQQICKRMLS